MDCQFEVIRCRRPRFDYLTYLPVRPLIIRYRVACVIRNR